jgi:U4/U6.U5 tri-snRNP-associated protein 3
MDIDPPGPPTKGKRAIEEVEDDPVAAEMRRMMGFAGFKSTKNTKVPGNDIYMVRKEKKTEYRQYMNRVGGFNRPLSPSR